VARFVPQKNISLLIKAFSKVQAANPGTHLLVVGQGKEERDLKILAKKMLPGNSYTFMSWSNDVPALMATADFYALSSNYEGWGRVLIEAQAAGLPIVTTDVGCVGEAILTSKSCWVVKVADTNSFSTALTETLQNLDSAKSAASTQKSSLATENVSNEEYAKEWTEVLEKTLHAKL
jgi:glycosyltransferase involved in cell wall biosynthesis